MNEDLIKWLFGIAGVWMSALTLAGVKLLVDVARIQTFMAFTSQKAAEILHSPHTPELDFYLEKFIAKTMTDNDRRKLLEICEGVAANKDADKQERALAARVVGEMRIALKLPMTERVESGEAK